MEILDKSIVEEDRISARNLSSTNNPLVKVKKKTQIISMNGRKVVSLNARNRSDPKTWDTEYLEHILYRLVYALISPFPVKKRVIAKRLGLTIRDIQNLISSSSYQRIKNSLRKELRGKWGANIDAVVIKKALQGSKYHAELFYKLQNELIDRTEVTKKKEFEVNSDERKDKISKYIEELGFSK